MAEEQLMQNGIALLVIVFIILLVWSRIQNQRMIDTVKEIRDIMKGGQ